MDSKLRTMIDGGAAIVDHEWLNSVARTDYGSEIRTCWNRQGVGTRDCFVGWIYDSGKPLDLEFTTSATGLMIAKGSLPPKREPEGFTLANDPPKPKHKRGEFYGQERTLQKVLIDGLDCIPGQLDLF